MENDMIPDEDLQKYAHYLARRYYWILDYHSDYSIEDLEVLAAMAIIKAVRDAGTETRRWVNLAPLHYKNLLRDELHIYQERQRFTIGCTSNKVHLDAPIYADSERTPADLLPDPDQLPEDRAVDTSIRETLRDALYALNDAQERECIVLHYVDLVSITELAKTLQITRQGVIHILNRGKDQLRKNPRLREIMEAGLDAQTPYYRGTGQGAWRTDGLSAPERLTIWRDEQRQRMGLNGKDAQQVDVLL